MINLPITVTSIIRPKNIDKMPINIKCANCSSSCSVNVELDVILNWVAFNDESSKHVPVAQFKPRKSSGDIGSFHDGDMLYKSIREMISF